MKKLNNFFKFLSIASFCAVLSACEEEQSKDSGEKYSGPLITLQNVETLYSDSAMLRIKLNAKKQLEFENGDRSFPEGITMVFHEKGKPTSTLTADQGKYNKQKDIYTVSGNVVIKSIDENKYMTGKELNWNPATKQVTSDKFVRIVTPKEELWGEGLIATQDFKQYKILKPQGFLGKGF